MFGGLTFYTEGGRSTGLGHVVRSIAIADALAKCGVPVNFVLNGSEAATALLKATPFPYVAGSVESASSLRQTGGVVVVDTKKDFTALARALKSEGRVVVAIDNLIPNPYCDAVIIPSATFDPGAWAESNPGYAATGGCRHYGGSDYVIVAKKFLAYRDVKKEVAGGPLKVLISMGGSDPNGLSALLVDALRPLDGIEVSTVIGSAAKLSDKTRATIRSAPGNFSFLFGVTNLAPLAANSDIVFTALGITVYELASIGLPSILVGNYAADVEEMGRLESFGICRSLGFYRDVKAEAVRNIVLFLSEKREELALMGRRARALVDGNGAKRVADILVALLRSASAEPGVRENGMSHA